MTDDERQGGGSLPPSERAGSLGPALPDWRQPAESTQKPAGYERRSSGGTREYERSDHPVDLEPEQIEYWARRLDEERLLVLESEDFRVVRRAADEILFRSGRFSQHRKRCLDLDGIDDKSAIDDGLEQVLEWNLSDPEPSVAVAFAFDDGPGRNPQKHLQLLAPDLTALRTRLGVQRRWVLVVATKRIWRSCEREVVDYVVRDIPYEEPHLKRVYPSTYKELAQRFRQLKRENRLGLDSREAMLRFLDLAHHGRVDDELKRMTAAQASPGPIVDGSPIESALLFVASYFSGVEERDGLVPSDLSRLVVAVLGDSFEEKERPGPEPGSPPIATKSRYDERWLKNPKEWLERAGLHQDTRNDGLRIAFVDPERRWLIRRSFQSIDFWLLDAYTTRLLRSNFLVDPRQLVRDGLTALIVRRALLEESAFSSTWLENCEFPAGMHRLLAGPLNRLS